MKNEKKKKEVVVLKNMENGKVKKIKKGFSVKFLIFGSLVYLFSKRYVRTLFSWIWYFLTLVWVLPRDKVNGVITDIGAKIAELFEKMKLGDIGAKVIEGCEFITETVNKRVVRFKGGNSITLAAIVGVALWLAFRIIKAARYNAKLIKRYQKDGYQEGQTAHNYGYPGAPTGPGYSYETNPTAASARAMESKKIIELRLLHDAYKSGLITFELYEMKRKMLEGN